MSGEITFYIFNPLLTSKDFVHCFPELEQDWCLPEPERYAGNLYQHFFSQFSYPENELPIAALYAQPTEHRYFLQLHPVHIQTDMHSAYMQHPDVVNLTEAESTQLFADIQAFWQDEPHELIQTEQGHWLLKLDAHTDINTVRPDCLVEQSIQAFMTTGQDKNYWLRLFTEMQMFLYQHPINAARREQGLLEVNALWFASAGVLPHRIEAPIDLLVSDLDWVEALARYANIKYTRKTSCDTVVSQQHIIVAFDTMDAITPLLPTVLQQLHKSQITSIACYFMDNTYFKLKPEHAKSWWQRLLNSFRK